MHRVILDASALVAAMAKDGLARSVLLGKKGVHFIAPPDVLSEAEEKIPKLAAGYRVDARIVASVLSRARARVTVIPHEALVDFWPAAIVLAEAAHAEGDEAYIAVGLLLRAPIWSYDRDFDRVPGMRRINARDVLTLPERDP